MPHHDHSTRQQQRRFAVVLGVTLVFLLIETIGGWLTGSLALLADAGHLLGDAGALSAALLALRLTDRPATTAMTYGYHRAEILTALFNGLALWLIAGLIWHEAFSRLHAPPPVQGGALMVIAAAGLGANLFGYYYLCAGPQTLNTKAAALHLLGDILGSAGALLAGLLIVVAGWTLADPLIGFVIGGLILATSWGVVKDSIDVLMEATPRGVDPVAIMKALGTVPGLEAVHDLHVWSLRSGVTALTVHGVIAEESADAEILDGMTRLLAERFGIHHTTIQLDRRQALVQIESAR